MKVEKAPLILIDFFIIDSTYKFIDPGNIQIDIRTNFNKYQLDFDFSAQKEENGEILLLTKISINEIKNPLPGYSIFLEGVAIFSFDENIELSENEKADYIYLSGLSISINSLRTFLSNTTSSYPFGKYQLPALDVGALHKEKERLQKK